MQTHPIDERHRLTTHDRELNNNELNPIPATHSSCMGLGYFNPRMLATDPVSKGMDPENSWQCELCSRKWTESVASEASKGT